MNQTLEIADRKVNVPYNFFEYPGSKSVTIFISGSGGTKEEWNPLVEQLQNSGFDRNILTFSFTGREDGKSDILAHEATDLSALCLAAHEAGYDSFQFVGASQAGGSIALAATDPEIQHLLSHVILLDPADYRWDDLDKIGDALESWNGAANYDEYDGVTLNDLMSAVPEHINVQVINFLLQNCDGKKYIETGHRKRDEHHDNGYPRLNNSMVKSFAKKTLRDDVGYIEDTELPHAFFRDGDVAENVRIVADYIVGLLRPIES